MRITPTTTLVAAFLLASGFAFALPMATFPGPDATNPTPQRSGLPSWITEGKPGTGPVFLVRGRVGSGVDASAGYAWLGELERFHFAWGGAVAGAQDVVFMIEAPDHEKLDALIASGPWSQVAFTVEPLVRTKDRLARTGNADGATPGVGAAGGAPKDADTPWAPDAAPRRPIAEPNHGDGTTHPAP
jgi:hypothetical protein